MPTIHERLKRRLAIIRLAVISTLALAGLMLCLSPGGCAYWPDAKDNAVDCAKEAGRDVFAAELIHLQDLIRNGVTYDTAASYAAGLVFRFGKPFAICLWQRLRGEPGGAFGSPEAQMRAIRYSDKWLAENASAAP